MGLAEDLGLRSWDSFWFGGSARRVAAAPYLGEAVADLRLLVEGGWLRSASAWSWCREPRALRMRER